MIWMLFACTARPEWVVLSGTVFEAGSDEDVVGQAQVRVLDYALEEVDLVEADSEGRFSAQARFGSYVFLDLSAEGYAHTGFTGTVGTSDYAIPDGVVWMRSDTDLEELKAAFEGCPLLADGGAIEGEILMACAARLISDQQTFPFRSANHDVRSKNHWIENHYFLWEIMIAIQK